MAVKHFLVILAIAGLGLAGCLDDEPPRTSNPEPQESPWGPATRYDLPEDPMPEGPGHDHASAEQHQFLWNYELASHDPIFGNQVNAAGSHAIDVEAGHLFAAVYGSHTVAVDGGLVIWDLSDPAQPVQTGRWVVPGSVGGDRSISATSDGNFVVLSTEPVTCFTQASANPFTVYLIDTTNKALPVVADVITVAGPSLGSPEAASTAFALGTHSVWVHEVGGQDYAFLSGTIYRIDRTENGGRLVATGASVPIGHDMYVRDTPYNMTLGLAAGGSLRVHDLSDPENPSLLANWAVPDDPRFNFDYYVHTADIVFLEDMDIIVVTTEDWLGWASQMFVLDATPLRFGANAAEPLHLEMIGNWTAPGNKLATGLGFSMHNPRFTEDGILSLSYYHGGMWQMDFRHPELRAEPSVVAYAAYAQQDGPAVMDPTQSADACGLGYSVQAPTYMDVENGPDGIVYLADVYTGLYTFKPTASHPVYGTGA